MFEISEYLENKAVSGKLLEELKSFLNNLWSQFKDYDPFFVIFYDDGNCAQNKEIMNTYKANRTTNRLFEDDTNAKLYKKIRKVYYHLIKEQFTKDDISFVFYSHDWETDLVPHYCLKYDIFDARQSEVLNLILSVDKDLLQTTEYSNVLQCITFFKANKELGKYQIHKNIYDKDNAISYIYNNFQPGLLTAKYIPMILSFSGDKVDDIMGLKGIGAAKAIKFIENNKIPFDLEGLRQNLKDMPDLIQKNIDTIIRNYKLISFDEQIKRLPKEFLCT